MTKLNVYKRIIFQIVRQDSFYFKSFDQSEVLANEKPSYLAIGLDAVLEAVELPASVSNLDSGLWEKEKILSRFIIEQDI